MMDKAAPDVKNTFHLSFDGGQVAGKSLYFQMLSAFQQTFKDGKLRMDLANHVNDLGGKFLRMPGGNNMEGPSAPYRWMWDKTIGSRGLEAFPPLDATVRSMAAAVPSQPTTAAPRIDRTQEDGMLQKNQPKDQTAQDVAQ